MNKSQNIFHFFSTRQVDYVTCPMDKLLWLVDQYANDIEDKKYFSSQMLFLSNSIEENRNGMDAIRVSMKVLELVSNDIWNENPNAAHAKSDQE